MSRHPYPISRKKDIGPPFEKTFSKFTSTTTASHVSPNIQELFIVPKLEDFPNQHEYIEALILHSIVSLNLALCNYRLSSITLPVKGFLGDWVNNF